jgi:LytR cell envelope-related transcriptional attenuator
VTAPGRSASTPPPPDAEDPRTRTIGIVLIAVAVLIGVVLLAKGFSQEDGLVSTAAPADERTTTTTQAAASGGTGVEEETTTTTAAANPPANVSVLVANGSGKSGVAGANADKLKAKDFTKVDTANAPTTAKSTVYYASGAQADAQAVATALGLDPAAVAAMPSPPAVDLKGATVLVVIGSDKA